MKIKLVLNFNLYTTITLVMLLSSCATPEKILYMQNLDTYNFTEQSYIENMLQVDDILDIKVAALVPEAAIPYNKSYGVLKTDNNNLEVMRLNGYLVSKEKMINFPVLGSVSVSGKTITSLENELKKLLISGGYLIEPTISVRLLNAKVTILGEVNSPGTYTFTENNISFLQALGMAGDLNINANRKNISFIRNIDGVKTATRLDLTSTEWLNGSFATVKPNDVVVVNPNGSKIKSSGFFGNSGSFVSIASLIISTAAFLINSL